MHKLLEHRSIGNPTFLHIIHSFQELDFFSQVYLVFWCDSLLLVYDFRKLVGSQGSKVIHLVAAYVCAVSRLMVSLAQPGNTQKEVFGSFNLPGVER